MGFVHRAVVEYIQASNYAVQTEVRIDIFWRADVVQNGAVWEVKHAGVNPALRSAQAALQAYGYVMVSDDLNSLGNAHTFSGSFYIQYASNSYEVSYTTPFDGVILYSVTEKQNYTGEFFKVRVPVTKERKQPNYQLSPSPANAAVTVIGIAIVGGLALAAFYMPGEYRVLQTS